MNQTKAFVRSLGPEGSSVFWRVPAILSAGCIAGFALILSLPSRHGALWPVSLLLLPLGLVLALIGWGFYLLAGLTALLYAATHGGPSSLIPDRRRPPNEEL